MPDGDAVVGLVGDPTNGCRFVPLDENGVRTGPSVMLTQLFGDDQCYSPAAACGDVSFMLSSAGRWDLVTAELNGAWKDGVPLPLPAGGMPWRFVLRDGSFLLSGGAASPTLQHLSPSGEPLAAASDFAENAFLVETSTGVLAAWIASQLGTVNAAMFTRPLDDDGNPTAAPLMIEPASAIQVLMLTSTPGGDAMLLWERYGMGSVPSTILAQALAPDGSPRSAPTMIPVPGEPQDASILVSPDGERALVLASSVLVDETDMTFHARLYAVPLACVP
jgi:hypothetical protein